MSIQKIGVVGTVVYDEIHALNQPVCASWGGLSYCFLTLAAIAPEIKVIPVVNMGRDLYNQALNDFKSMPNIDTSCIYPVSDKTNRVILRYYSNEERVEIQKGQMPPLTSKQIEPILDCDLIIVNFISGKDIEQNA